MEKRLPLVSIVTPSYNTGIFIEETILSVKNQTYPHIEHIIMDAGSTDGSVDIIRKYEGTYNMSWISEPDKGQSDAINRGWQKSRGEIICWLNSDDTYLPQTVETAVDFLENHPDAGMVYGECHIINENSAITGRCQARVFDLKRMLCRGNLIPQPATFWRRDVLNEVGELDTELHYSMDFDYWLRIALKYNIAYIPQYLANFRRCPGTKSVSQSASFALDQLHVVNKLYALPELPPEVKQLERHSYSRAYYQIGLGYYSQRHMKTARKYLFQAIKLNPRILANPYVAGYLAASFLRKSNG